MSFVTIPFFSAPGFHLLLFSNSSFSPLIATMPALDIDMVSRLGHDLHPASTGLMSEGEVCPWTLFLTMALTLLKGKPRERQTHR